MKQIAIVTQTGKTRLGDALRKNLEEVLGGKAGILEYAFERLAPGEQLEGDLVLAMARSKALELRDHVPDSRRILVVNRTLRERSVYRIFTIPPGTRVLVVNDAPETTLETVALLQQLEINHLQYVPYEPGMDCGDLRIAITPGERKRVPASIGTVIDLGHRCIDISTFIEIINRLGIADREVDRRLLRYSEAIVTLDRGVNRQTKELFLRNTELDAVLNLSHEGVLLVNTEGKVALVNRALAEMLDLRADITGQSIEVLEPEIRELLARRPQKEWIAEHRGRSLVITRRSIEHLGEAAGTCYNVQEVTYIRQLEQNLSRRLKARGLTARYSFQDVLTRSPRMQHCVELARRIAQSEHTVLILGESGTGKELLAQSIHRESSRSKQPFVAVNCAAVPEALLESELFGYEGGSFTGALKEGKPGLFVQADHGTIFLDEVADMPLMLQAKLLRVLQERQVMRIGSEKVVSVNLRVIAATNHDLRERIRQGLFRKDLYYRLNTLPLLVPPLRERTGDVFPLLEHFLEAQGRPGLDFDPESRALLLRYTWPGNVRELINVASYLSFMAGERVTPDVLPHYLLDDPAASAPARAVLERTCGLDRARRVLAALAEGPGGRKGLGELLAAQGHSLTEGEIRGILKVLREQGLVHPRIGRRGTELTPEGRAWLNRS
jgi:transcriptional regulator with PAS, ATPase and Fis domain